MFLDDKILGELNVVFEALLFRSIELVVSWRG